MVIAKVGVTLIFAEHSTLVSCDKRPDVIGHIEEPIPPRDEWKNSNGKF